MIVWMLLAVLAGGCLALAGLAVERSAAFLGAPRRWGWLAAMALAGLLPVIFRWLPAPAAARGGEAGLDPALLAQLLATAPTASDVAGAGPMRVITGDVTATAVWVALSATMVMVLLGTYLRLRRLRAVAEPIHCDGVPALLTSGSGPMVVGVRRPEIVLPRWIESVDETERRLVVRHEWEHARARDPLLLFVAAIVVAAMPWNPALWWMRRRLRQALEVDCDARVLAAGADRRAYGAMLIRTAGRPGPAPLLAPALVELPSLLERRIVAMTSRIPSHARLRAAVAGSAALVLFVAACEMTPRGSGPTPTEPTMADVLEPVAEDVTVIATMDFAEDVAATHINPEGNVVVARIGPDGDTVWTEGVRIRAPFGGGVDGNPLYIVDGERVESIEGLDPYTIMTVDVIKGPTATAIYGDAGADGVVHIRTADRHVVEMSAESAAAEGGASPRIRIRGIASGDPPSGSHTILRTTDGSTAKPFILVDGQRVNSMEGIDPATVDRIEVIKGESAIERFGEEAADGAVIVTRKR